MLIGVISYYKDALWRLGIYRPFKMLYIYDEQGNLLMNFPVSSEVIRWLKDDFDVLIINEEELWPPSIRKVFYLEEEARKLTLPEIAKEVFGLSPKEYPILEEWRPTFDIAKYEVSKEKIIEEKFKELMKQQK